MKRISLFWFFFCFLPSLLLAQKGGLYPVNQIPDSLCNNAYSVVRFESNDFQYNNPENGLLKVVRVVTILNSKGSHAADFSDRVGRFWKLKNFSGKIVNEDGTVIQKIKMSDLHSTNISSELASDESVTFYQCNHSVYPFTVIYEYEEEWINGMMDFPSFTPMQALQQSVQQSVYRPTLPNDVGFQVFAHNMSAKSDSLIDKNRKTYTWTLNGLPAIDEEYLMPSFASLAPKLMLKPLNFHYDKSSGSLASWNDVGRWLWSLSYHLDELSPEVVQKIQALTVGAATEKEKVRRLYDYLQHTTRYVSIQLGIGGYQPMSAAVVSKTGFSDCKGLSNYMISMLKAVGIPSFYAIINTEYAHFIPSFAGPRQANHAIVIVPLENDTIPLECTSADMPFGYVHHEIAGHDALLVTPSGGKLYRLNTYPDSASYEHHTMDIQLTESGEMQANVHSVYNLAKYEEMMPFEKVSTNDDRTKIIMAGYRLPSLKINNIVLQEHHDSLPSFDLRYTLVSDTYATTSGKHLFLSVNPRKNVYPFFSTAHRKYAIDISDPIYETDTMNILIPKGMLIEKVPADLLLKKPFGMFSSHRCVQGQKVQMIQSIMIPKEVLSADKKDEFKAFLDAVNNAYQDQIVLKKL
ncbi:MAG: transglutaminase-like domain-containing protein [Microbacter sp.]